MYQVLQLNVYIFVFVIEYAKHVFSAPYSIVICGLSGSTIFFHTRIINEMIFGNNIIEYKIVF
jgi:hypothetical protein